MKKIIFAIITAATTSAFASLICSDSSTDFRYEHFQQEGGACCGRSSETVTYKGKIIKREETINDFGGGNGGRHTDTNPELKVTSSQPILLGNSYQSNDYAYSEMAMNITLENLDNKAVLPGEKASTVTKSVVCTESHSLIPRP
jgi:hypothetical protein